MTWVRVHLIVPSNMVARANQAAALLDSDAGGLDTFSVPIIMGGGDVITHYGASGLMREDTLNEVKGNQLRLFPGAKVHQSRDIKKFKDVLKVESMSIKGRV